MSDRAHLTYLSDVMPADGDSIIRSDIAPSVCWLDLDGISSPRLNEINGEWCEKRNRSQSGMDVRIF